jgi:CBS domain-containing protein
MEGPQTRGNDPTVGSTVTVWEAMTREFVGVSESDSLAGAVDLLLAEDANTAVVLRGTDPVGLLGATDALGHLREAGSFDDAVDEAMTESTPTVAPDTNLQDAATRLADVGVDCLLVGEDDLLGVVTRRDVASATTSLTDRPEPMAVTGAATGEEEPAGNEDHDFATQSLCEVCGSLTPELQNFNGKLVCGDCRDV